LAIHFSDTIKKQQRSCKNNFRFHFSEFYVIIFRDKGNASFAIIRDKNSEAARFNREAENERAEAFINLCAGKSVTCKMSF
jgi:hypothetical protein